MMPALLTRRSRSPLQPSANVRTEASDARSSGRTSRAPGKLAATASPLATSRTARTTCAPARASSRAVTAPRPLEAPVTTTVRPERSGRSAAVQREEAGMRGNVVGADKGVNDNNAVSVYSARYPVPLRMTTAARPYHHGNLREALLDAGERALESGGAANLSLRELAREVGVSHAA